MKRAIRLILNGTVEVLETDPNRTIKYGRGEMEFPTVVKLKRLVKIPERLRSKVTNTFLFARDNYTCQYCGRHERDLKGRNVLTRDHVFPKSRGGLDTWQNCVTACTSCNSRKDDKTLDEADMKLLSRPMVPHMVHLKWQIRKLTPMQEKYITMFYGENWTLYVDK